MVLLNGWFIQLLIEALFAATQHLYKESTVHIRVQGAVVGAVLIVTIFEQSFEKEKRFLLGPFAECFDKSDAMSSKVVERLNLFNLLQSTGGVFSSFVLL